jgi:dienelactone hydrolase
MRRPATLVAAGVVALVSAMLGGCSPSSRAPGGSPADTGPSTSTNTATSTSTGATAVHPAPCGPGATAFWLPGPGNTGLEANAFGRGRSAAVFLHEAGRVADMCGFWPYARWLAVHHHVLVVLVNRCTYGASTCQLYQQGDAGIVAQTRPAVEWARRHGARRVTLIGASTGASDALQAGGVVPHVAAVVDLSGDVTDTGADDRADARRLRVPALFAVAPEDDVSPVPAMRAVYRLVPSRPKRLVIVRGAGSTHGWDLLRDPVGGRPTPLARLVAEWVVGRVR